MCPFVLARGLASGYGGVYVHVSIPHAPVSPVHAHAHVHVDKRVSRGADFARFSARLFPSRNPQSFQPQAHKDLLKSLRRHYIKKDVRAWEDVLRTQADITANKPIKQALVDEKDSPLHK